MERGEGVHQQHERNLEMSGFLFSFSKSTLGSVVVLVLEIQNQVERNEAEVQHIEPDDVIDLVVDELVDDAEDIAQQDEAHENGTLALGDLRPQRLGDADRPTDGEAEKEKDFEDFHWWFVLCGDKNITP